MIKLILPVPPILNTYYRNFRGIMVLSKKGREYKQTVAEIVKDIEPIEGQVIIYAKIYRPARRGDADSYGKALLDSLKDKVFGDDALVAKITLDKLYDKDNPRAEVFIKKAGSKYDINLKPESKTKKEKK